MSRRGLPQALAAAWPDLRLEGAQRVSGGLINATWWVRGRDGGDWALQRLNPIFPPEVNLDIAAVTRHLAAKGQPTPRLRPNAAGGLWVEAGGAIWRCLSWMEGRAWEHLRGPAMAREAGALVGRFHAALTDLRYVYRSQRPGIHDTDRHLAHLEAALGTHGGHRLYPEVVALARPLLARARGLESLAALPLRHAHGDLKISNLLFAADGTGLCLIDLDTLGLMPWPLEMGDALRSWCNPAREDDPGSGFDLDLAEAALTGYARASGGLVDPAEWEALPWGVARISLELAARFLSDALEESYFGWDAGRYRTAGEHNLARGAAMWRLYLDVEEKGPALARLCARIPVRMVENSRCNPNRTSYNPS